MKKLLLILILGAGFMWGYSQTRNELEPIISMYHEKIVVRLYRSSDSTYPGGSIRIYSLNNDKFSIPVFSTYYSDIYNPENINDSLFQDLYNWLEKIQSYVAKYEYKEVYTVGDLIICGPEIIIDFPLIYIKDINCDCYDFSTWDSGMIAKLKKRTIEYTTSHNISIKL